MLATLSAALSAAYGPAAVAKLRDRRTFSAYLRPLTHRATPVAVRLIFAAEGLLAVALMAGAWLPDARPWAGGASGAFVLAATGAHGLLLARTETAACHCFGRLSTAGHALDATWKPALFAARNASLAALSLLLADRSLESRWRQR